MADDKIYTLSEASIRKLAEDHRRLEGMVQNLRTQTHQPFAGRNAPELYHGTTATNDANPTYPAADANTFVVRLSDVKFDEAIGDQAVDKEASELYVVARTHDGSYVAEGTEVLLEKRTSRSGPRWWIVTGTTETKLYPFELMQDRTTGAYEERLPVILIGSYGAGCDLPESNPDAEAMIDNWSTLKSTYPDLNAQLAWYHDSHYPYARGPMEEADCGVVGGSGGALGLLAFHPDVSLEDDDEQAESETSFCLKRFEVLTSDQRSHRFSVVCKEDFYGDDDDDYWCYTARMDVSKAPQPLNQWPFSQAAHWWEFFGYLSDPGESTVESKETCSIQNVERYKGHIDDPGAVDWDESTGQWALSRTRVYSHRVVGDFRYNDCKIEGWYDDFKAYGKPPPDPEWETIIQLYQTTISKNLATRISIGSDLEADTLDDVCVYEEKQATICTFDNLTEIEYGEEGYDDSDWKWVDTNVEQTLYKYVSDVTIGSTEISFSTGYFFASCDPREADPITIEFTEECPEDPPA